MEMSKGVSLLRTAQSLLTGRTIIKVEIKQTKMIFFCLHFNPVFTMNTEFDYTCTATVCLGEIEHVHHIGMTSHFVYVERRITRSTFAIPLDFEIARLTCILWCSVTSVLYGTDEIHLHTYFNTMSEHVTLQRCTVTFPRHKCLQVDVVEYTH